jgi:hypothetical protein
VSHNANVAVWKYSDPALTPIQLLVLVALADYANPDSALLWPSFDNVATRCHVSRSTVKRAVAELVAMGQLERVRQGGGQGRHDTTVFRFCLVDNLGGKGVTLNPLALKGGQIRALRGSETTVKGVTGEPQTRKNPNEPRARVREEPPPMPDKAELANRIVDAKSCIGRSERGA